MEIIWFFLSGLFAWNGVPHLVKGITGQSHMTPFKKISSPKVNVFYGFLNLIFSLFFLGLASGNGGLTLPWDANLNGFNLIVFIAGGLFIAFADASLFSNPKAKLPWQK